MSNRDPLTFLQDERQLIARVVDGFERYASLLAIGNENSHDLPRFIAFFREFAAAIHHKNKEALAFAALPQLPREVRTRLQESHRREQTQLLGIMHLGLTADLSLDEERARLASLISGFAASQRSQLNAERTTLYPALRDALESRNGQRVSRTFQESLSSVAFAGQYDWLHRVGSQLAEQYSSS